MHTFVFNGTVTSGSLSLSLSFTIVVDYKSHLFKEGNVRSSALPEFVIELNNIKTIIRTVFKAVSTCVTAQSSRGLYSFFFKSDSIEFSLSLKEVSKKKGTKRQQ